MKPLTVIVIYLLRVKFLLQKILHKVEKLFLIKDVDHMANGPLEFIIRVTEMEFSSSTLKKGSIFFLNKIIYRIPSSLYS